MSGLRRVALLGVVAALALTAAACGGDDSSNAAPAPNGGPAVGQAPGDLTCPPPNIATIDPQSLKVDAEPVGSLVSGKPATFKITITNVTEGPVPLVFASSQQADVLLSQGDKQVYDWQAEPCVHAGAPVPDAQRRRGVHDPARGDQSVDGPTGRLHADCPHRDRAVSAGLHDASHRQLKGRRSAPRGCANHRLSSEACKEPAEA